MNKLSKFLYFSVIFHTYQDDDIEQQEPEDFDAIANIEPGIDPAMLTDIFYVADMPGQPAIPPTLPQPSIVRGDPTLFANKNHLPNDESIRQYYVGHENENKIFRQWT